MTHSADTERAESLLGLCEEADIEDLPTTQFADAVIHAANRIDGFRYQILVGRLAKKAAIHRSRTTKKVPIQWVDLTVCEYIARMDVLGLADLLRWSDSLRASRDLKGRYDHEVFRPVLATGSMALYQLVRQSLAADVLTATMTDD